MGAARATSSELSALGRQLYEDVWSNGNVQALDTIMAEDHAQNDVIWMPEQNIGRDKMAKGITAYRSVVQDLKFIITSEWANEETQSCVVEWDASGVQVDKVPAEGDQVKASLPVAFRGISVLQVEGGQIAATRVYRVPPPGERRMFRERQTDA